MLHGFGKYVMWTRFPLTESTISIGDVVIFPGLLPIFLHSCKTKFGSFWLVMYELTSSKMAMLLLPYLKLWETTRVALPTGSKNCLEL